MVYVSVKASNPIDAIRGQAHPFAGTDECYQRLLEEIGDSRFVLIGEATHGTHDFYFWRAEITKRLVEQKGFSTIAIEGDWPDAVQVNRYVSGVIGGTAFMPRIG